MRENNDQNTLNENAQGINKNIKRSIFSIVVILKIQLY